jgi:hypothetical protein
VIDIKIVQPPVEPRLARHVDFDLTDADEWGRYAIKSQAWQVWCVHDATARTTLVETAVSIAAPDGRVAVWFGRATARAVEKRHGKRQNTTLRAATSYAAAFAATGCAAFAMHWDDKRTRGGDRDVRALAMAAGRILHTRAFGGTPTLRDQLLAEFALIAGAKRPDTSILLRASENALLAASALAAAQNYRGAQLLLAGKGVTA